MLKSYFNLTVFLSHHCQKFDTWSSWIPFARTK